ncbi:hypothetical protein B5S27_g2854 [[Candida] boidinii]|nr:hypothetical protein B5S27_g2854 [[Candida] boidinii]
MNKQGRYFPGKGRYESDSDGDSDSDSDKEDRRNEERVSNDKKISSVGSNLKKDGRQSGSTNTKISQLVFNDGQIVQSKTPIQRTISKEEEEEEEQEEEEEDEEEEEEEEEESGSESSSSSSEEEYTKPVRGGERGGPGRHGRPGPCAGVFAVEAKRAGQAEKRQRRADPAGTRA